MQLVAEFLGVGLLAAFLKARQDLTQPVGAIEVSQTDVLPFQSFAHHRVAVKAMGLALPGRGLVQVSMNLTDIDRTSIADVFDAVSREAARDGVEVLESEVVGLLPARALIGAATRFLRLPGFDADRLLETRLAP